MTSTRLRWLVLIVIYLATVYASYQIQTMRFAQVNQEIQETKSIEFEFQLRSEPRQYLARFASDQEQIQYSVAVKLIKITTAAGQLKLSVPATATFQTAEFDFYRGQTLRATGELIEASQKYRSCCLLKIKSAPELVSDANFAFKFAAKIRANSHLAMTHALPNGAALVPGLVLGDTSTQSTELEVAMRGSGLAHLTAVSGGNVTIVLGLFIAIFSLFGLSRNYLVVIAVIALGIYVLAVGFDASVMRAAAMGSITLLAFVSKNATSTGKILIGAIYVLTVFNPWLLLNWGFLLSATATAGLIWFAPAILRAIPWRAPFNLVGALIAATVAASWLTAPLLAVMTSTIPVVTILANLIAAPLVAVTTVLGLIAALLALINPLLAVPLSALASWPAELIAQIALKTSSLPGAQIELTQPSHRVVLLLVIVAVVLAIVKFQAAKITLYLLLGLVLLWPVAVASFRQFDGWPPKNAALIACDVGQGTAVAVPLTPSSAVLFDVGGDPAAINQCLAKAGINHLLAIYISHFHADHAAGLAGAISDRRVDQIFISPNLEPNYQYESVKLLAAKKGIEPKILTAGTQIQLAELKITTLWPLAAAVPVNENDASLILLVEREGFKFLFTGDLEPAGQGALMELLDIDVDVALVPHHGSKFQAKDFAAWTRAEFGIISVGENRFGHPAAETLQNWEQQAVVLRTDLAGDIAILRSPSGLRAVSR